MSSESFHVAAPVKTVETPAGKDDKRKIIIETSKGERTLWTFVADKDGNVHPWMAGVVGATLTNEIVVFHGFMSKGTKANERTGRKPTFYNVTKAEPFDAAIHSDVPAALPLLEETPAEPATDGAPAGGGWGGTTGAAVGASVSGQTGGTGPAAASPVIAPDSDRDDAWRAVTLLIRTYGHTLLPEPPVPPTSDSDPAVDYLGWTRDRALKIVAVVDNVTAALRTRRAREASGSEAQ